jgi:RNA 2',3'-cyclic 3'-phosphodiesterase
VTPPAAVEAGAWRVFVAIRVPRAVAEAIVAAARSVAPPPGPVRWVDPAELHVTLWFIGRLDAAQVPGIHDRLADLTAGAAPFDVEVAGAGSFGRGRGRATWVGLAAPGAGRIAALAAELHDEPFHAHITISRGAPSVFADALAERLPAAPSLAWRVTALEVLRSHPGRRPAYETIDVASFGGGRGTA